MKTGQLQRKTGLKQSGFKRPTFAQHIAKQKANHAKRISEKQAGKVTVKTPTQYPSFAGVKNSRRWVGLRGAYWTIFSMYTRKRDFIKYGGRCVSCPKILEDWRDGDAGHYVSVARGGIDLCFDEKNVHLQCKRCNNPTWTVDASIPFAEEIDRRYGAGLAKSLSARVHKEMGKVPSKEEYKALIINYKAKFDAL